jgi:hypothetical protein
MVTSRKALMASNWVADVLRCIKLPQVGQIPRRFPDVAVRTMYSAMAPSGFCEDRHLTQ